MEYRIERFDASRLAEWLDFFDTRAFADNPEWKGCYCTFYHKPREASPGEPEFRTNRDYAVHLLREGRLTGYVVLDDTSRVVGWCNVGAKAGYPRLRAAFGPEEAPSVLSIVCFILEKEHRGKGLSGRIVERIIRDARAEGKTRIEAYPRKRARSETGIYHGSYKTYERLGFVERERGGHPVMEIVL